MIEGNCLNVSNEGTFEFSLFLFQTSFVAATVTLLFGHLGSAKPIDKLGQRPQGAGLLSYLAHYLRNSTGVRGYDSSLGSFAPIPRLLLHGALFQSFFGAFAHVVLSTYPLKNLSTAFFVEILTNKNILLSVDSECLSLVLFPSIINGDGAYSSQNVILYLNYLPITLMVYLSIWTFFLVRSKGVSHPGGPREHKIRRSPAWEDKTTHFEEKYSSKSEKVYWSCHVAQDSHSVTMDRFHTKNNKATTNGTSNGDSEILSVVSAKSGEEGVPLKKGLSGEPFGRQIWAHSSTVPLNSSADEELVEEMALGGRKKGFNPSLNPNSCDQIFRAQQIRSYMQAGGTPPDIKSKPTTPSEAAKKATHFYSMLLTEDGHWAGDYGGPHFLMPGVIIAWYVMGRPTLMIDEEQQLMMRHYLEVHQQSDGGWGTHIESPSTMFATVLCYVALRLLGWGSDSPEAKKAVKFIKDEGGAIMTSSWAKFWLCLLGCMEWEGHNSVPPEMWLLPNWIPFHPGRLWCHCRMVYLPMGYLYGSRYVYSKVDSDPLIAELRTELYKEPYETIPWVKTRNLVAEMDNYSPIPLVMKILQDLLALYENLWILQPLKNFVRARGLKFCIEYMAAEDLQTNFIDIGPVNKALNLVSTYHAMDGDIDHPAVQNHMMRIPDYLWLAEDGMKMQGYNGSQCWDTSFAIQAMYECNLLDEFPEVSKKVWAYLERTQILFTEVSSSSPAFLFESCENRDRFYRHVSLGGWPFSTSAHGWPISDCTGEGLKAVLALMKSEKVKSALSQENLKPISLKRLSDAINVLLTLQNEDGGWATYENNRGFGWYEQLNPSEVFGDIMIDYSYVECSMASLTALAEFHELYPDHRTNEIRFAIHRGKEFMKSIQREDGSWYGSWACCFTYGCWFGIEGLVKAGEPSSCPAIQKCVRYLLKQQRSNGGWGEDFTSCYDKDYAQNGMHEYGDDGSGVVNTAWALLALSEAHCDDVEAVKRGVQYLMKRQLPSGDFPQEGISGVFNRACGITYTAYRNVFPIWALGRCVSVYGEELLTTK